MSKRQTKTGTTSKTARKTAAKTTSAKSTKKSVTAKPLTKKPVTKASAKSGTSKKLVAKKTTAKPVSTTKAPTKKPAGTKPVVSKPAVSKPAVKAPSPKKPATRKETVATLRAHVDSIVTRLKTADTNTRRNVKSLETAISALERQVKSHQKVDHAALSHRVDQLSSHLTRSLDSTKRDISADLKNALQNPTVSGVEAAIERSEQRLADTEMAQARALSKVNKHLAELARVIDARFRNQEGETKENASKITELSQQVSQSYERISLVENTTADAIRKVGDEVVGTAETFQSKLESQSAALRERIEAIASRTQEDFDQQKTDMSRRMESIEDSHKNQSNYIDRSISKLAARIDSLEFGLSNLPEPAAAVPPVVLPSNPEATITPPPPLSPASIIAEPVQDAFAATTHFPSESDGFAYEAQDTAPPQVPVPLSEPAPEMADTPLNIFDQMAAENNAPPASVPPVSTTPPAQITPPPAIFTDSGINPSPPLEFSPQPVMATTAPQHHYVDPAQAAPYIPPPQSQEAYNYAPDNYAQEPAYTETTPQTYDYSAATPGQPVEFQPAISESELPYENPGYGEDETEGGITRPGHVTGRREKTKRKKPKKKFDLKGSSALSNLPITPRNLRVAGLAVALALVGYLGLRGFMGSDTDPEMPGNTPTIASVPPAQNGVMPQGTLPPLNAESDISTSAPIGDYQDNSAAAPAAVNFNGSQSLTEAATGGNPIAQFQLGISYLDAGRTKDGLGLIRKAANQGQPAAQYRLAKLYEAGIGVAADPDMARQLTERSARSGNRIAMHDLGLYYAEGRGGVERNLTTALSWFEKAAERGVVDSQYNLGILFGSTPEIPKDLVTAYVWFSVASKQGDQHAGNQLGALKSQMTPDELKQANARIAGFKPVAIEEAANGIFREVPWSMPDADSFSPTADLVRDAQTLLGQLGYEVGVPDGDMGPKTRAAVKAFEKANGLPESGNISGSLVDRLEAAAGV